MSESELPRLRLDFSALCGRRAVSPFTYAIAGLGLFLSSFEFEIVLPQAGVLDAFVIALTATAACLLVLLAADKTVLRERATRRLPLAVVLGVYVVCGIVRAVISSISAAAVDARGPELLARSLGGIVLVVAWLSIIAIVADYIDRDRATTKMLRNRRSQLTAQRDHYQGALTQGRRNISAFVDSVAGPAIEQSEELLGAVGADGVGVTAGQLSELASEIRDRAEGQVRSLSHSLATTDSRYSDVDAVAPRVDSAETRSHSQWFARAVAQSTAIDPIQPTAVTITVLIEIIPILTYLYGFRGLVQVSIVGAALIFLFLVGARRVLTPQLRHWSQPTRVAALCGVVVVAGLLGTASVFLWYSPQGWELAATALRCICVVGVAFVAWAVIASSAAQSVRTQREIAATIAEIEWETNALREDLIRVQRSAAEIVHGRVQGRIVAAALVIALQARRIDEGAPDASPGTVGALSEAAAILREARDDVYSIERADQASHRVDIVELLNSVGMAWRGVVDVDVDVDSSTVAAIDQSAPLAGHVAEVVREAVSNAARHGAARSVRIVLAAQAADTLAGPGGVDAGLVGVIVTATDDGVGVRGPVVPGLGLGQLAGSSSTWSLVPGAGGGAVLTVTIPAAQLSGA